MVQKSNMKVHNSSAHPVKGRNPYYSWWPMHSISQNWQEVYSLWFCTAIFLILFFKRLFCLGKCSFWLVSWQFFPSFFWRPQIHKLSLTPLSFHSLSRPWKAYPIFPKLSKTFKDRANPDRAKQHMKHILLYHLFLGKTPFDHFVVADGHGNNVGIRDETWGTHKMCNSQIDTPSVLLTITIYFIDPSGKLKLSIDHTTNISIILNHEPHAHTHS